MIVCKKCGGGSVYLPKLLNPNTGEMLGDARPAFCLTCDEDTGVVPDHIYHGRIKDAEAELAGDIARDEGGA